MRNLWSQGSWSRRFRAVQVLWPLCLLSGGCGQQPSPSPEVLSTPGSSRQSEAVAGQVDAFCGGCHATPHPEHFPRSAWREEVEQGFNLYFDSSRTDLPVPIMADVIRYYETRAPESIPLPASSQGVGSGPVSFVKLDSPKSGESVAIAHLPWVRLAADRPEELIACNMRSGAVQLATLADGRINLQTLATLNNPAHAEGCDLDGDGLIDLLVADLGSFTPSDHNKGRVVWLRRAAGEVFTPVVLADQLGRVSDVQPADVDADGDWDLLVAEFGWRKTGRVLLLENRGLEGGELIFETHVVDPRHGAIHILVEDLDHDGRLDFTTLLSQEHESIEVFFNRGQNQFQPQQIFAADRPSYGSSGLSSVDLDQDGDTDLLYTNGDMFDDYFLRTYHAVQWLENLGSNRWQPHELGPLPGVHRALGADLDLDGDMDVVACALVPSQVTVSHEGIQLDSLIWFEQTSPGDFRRHVIEVGACDHPTLTVADFDRDGDVDLAVGNYATSFEQDLPAFSIWWNQRVSASSQPAAASGP